MKDVLITIKGTQIAADDPDVMELCAVGTMEIINGKTILTYDDTDSIKKTKNITTLQIDGDKSLSIVRTGVVESRMDIVKKHRTVGQYSIEYGEFMMGIYGEKIENELTEDGGRFFAKYNIDINMETFISSELEIFVRETKGRK